MTATRTGCGSRGDTIGRAFDLQVDPGLLERRELDELVALCRRIIRVEQAPVLVSPHEQIEHYARKVIEISERPEMRPNQKANAVLIAERARSEGRIPSRAEVSKILANNDMGASLASLRLPSPEVGGIVSRGIDLGALDEKKGERKRLEELVEIASGAEPGSIFEPRREERKFRAQLAELAAKVAPGPRRRPLIDEPGVVSLPAEVWGDVLRSDGNGIYLQAVDLAVLACVLGILESRRLPEKGMATGPGFVWLEDDDNTLVMRAGVGATPWSSLGDLEGDLGPTWRKSLGNLHRCKWLNASQGDPIRITRGPRLMAFLAKREEVGS